MAEENVNPFNKFKCGDSVEVLIKKFTPKEHRIALSVKDIGKEPEQIAQEEATTEETAE